MISVNQPTNSVLVRSWCLPVTRRVYVIKARCYLASTGGYKKLKKSLTAQKCAKLKQQQQQLCQLSTERMWPQNLHKLELMLTGWQWHPKTFSTVR